MRGGGSSTSSTWMEPKVPMPSSISSSLSILVVMLSQQSPRRRKRFPRDEAMDKLVKGLDCRWDKFVEITYHIIIIKLQNSQEKMLFWKKCAED